jgi:Helicase conserved C-terminal domain/SNF2-related domain
MTSGSVDLGGLGTTKPTSAYDKFLATKLVRVETPGPQVVASDVHPMLHDWQNELVRWAVRTSRAAIWADTGLGKTVMQVEWARLFGGASLIVAPLAVCQQTVREAAKVGVTARYVRHGSDIDGPGVYVTNYEMVSNFDPSGLSAVVLDEASILKQSDGKTRTLLINHFADVPNRLACTATPAPNDPEELTNQAEFLGRMTRQNMLAAYFVHDSDGWRLKGHARGPMMRWMADWAVALRKPSDLGYPDAGYDLPGLRIVPHLIEVPIEAEGQLFPTDLGGVGGRAAVRRSTTEARCARAAELVAAEPDEPWLIWCGLNDEATLLAKLTGGTNVYGSMSPEEKATALLGFSDGDIQIMITKPGIASQGLNYQHCARMIFVGLSDSYEQYYQAIRRCYRYGQTRVVDAHVVLSRIESQIADNIARKEREASAITAQLVESMRLARLEAA